VRLRRRLNTVLLQWVGLLTVVMAAVWVVAVPSLRHRLQDDRLMLARSVAHGLDTSLSTAMQALGRLSTDLPDDPVAASARLHQFRFQSPFRDAVYLLNDQGQLLAGDPAGLEPIGVTWLGTHEVVTPLVRKSGAVSAPVLAMVQPFRRQGRGLYLVAEMRAQGSPFSTYLKGLAPSTGMDVQLVDAQGVVVAAQDPTQVLSVLPGAETYGDRIRANRPLEFHEPGGGLAVMAPLRYAAWGVIIRQTDGSTFASLDGVSRALLITGLALTVLGTLLVRTLSRSVVSPIRALSQQAEGMRAGDLTTPIAVSGDVEIEMLGRTLDTARVRLSSTLEALQTFNEALEAQVVARTRVIEAQHDERKVLVQRLLHATEDERRRLARELHDEIAQLLTVVQMSLHRITPNTVDLQQALDLLDKTQAEIHRLIHDLRPSLLDDLGLAAAMQSYADDHLTKHGVDVRLEIEDGLLPAATEIETVVFRIYQELLTNILRHADAEHVSVELYRRDDVLVLAVEDDGKGFDPSVKSGRAGLTGIRERAALVDGRVTFDSEAGEGTRVVLEIPIP